MMLLVVQIKADSYCWYSFHKRWSWKGKILHSKGDHELSSPLCVLELLNNGVVGHVM